MERFYNCHIHSFNGRYVPEYFLYGMAEGMSRKKSKFVGKLLKTPVIKRGVVFLLSKFGSASQKRYTEFLKIGIMNTQDMVFENASSFYPAGTAFIVLPVNFEFMGAGKLDISYTDQLDDLFEVKKKYPNTCQPFVFIDPRMGTAEQNRDFVRKYIEKGFRGIKMYPSLGYYPFDPRLELVYQYAEENNIPLITHCSEGGIYYNAKPVPEHLHAQSMNPQVHTILHEPGTQPLKRNYNFTEGPEPKEFKNNFIDPENYVDVLLKFPKLKICLAHFGGDLNHLDRKVKDPKAWTWYDKIKKLILHPDFKNVYTDISYSLHNKAHVDLFKQDLQVPVLQQRILFGTDYFMTYQEENTTEDGLYLNCLKWLVEKDFSVIAVENAKDYLASGLYKTR